MFRIAGQPAGTPLTITAWNRQVVFRYNGEESQPMPTEHANRQLQGWIDVPEVDGPAPLMIAAIVTSIGQIVATTATIPGWINRDPAEDSRIVLSNIAELSCFTPSPYMTRADEGRLIFAHHSISRTRTIVGLKNLPDLEDYVFISRIFPFPLAGVWVDSEDITTLSLDAIHSNPPMRSWRMLPAAA